MSKAATRMIGVLALAAVLAVLVMSFLPRPVAVDVARVQRGPFEETVDEDGRTRVRDRYVVSSPQAGRLLRIGLRAGEPVDRGRLLATMLPAPPAMLDVRTERELAKRLEAADAQHAKAQAIMAAAKAALDQALIDLGRVRTMAAEQLVPPAQLEREELTVTLRTREFEAAQFEDDAAAHQVELARAALLRARHGTDAKTAGERLDIHSPVSGRVLRVLAESEGVVPLGTPLLEIADPSDLEVVADVLSEDAVRLQPGMPVKIDPGQGSMLLGRVRLIEPSAFTKVSALGVEEQRVNVVIDLVSPFDQWSRLGDGYRVEVHIVVFEDPNAMKIPTGALFREGEEWVVFVWADGRARRRAVQVGHRGGAEAAVAAGLDVGGWVIVYPSDAVRDGVRVTRRSSG